MSQSTDIKLETERLLLRPFEISDAEAMFKNWASDPEVLRYMPYKICESLEMTRIRISEWMEYFNSLGSTNSWGAFAIELKHSGEVIGTVDYAELDREVRSAEVGYQIGKAWWGKGYATEALRAVIVHCFETTDINRLWGGYDPRNPASGKAMLKAGMQLEGTFRQYRLRAGELVDRSIHAILREDWCKQKVSRKFY